MTEPLDIAVIIAARDPGPFLIEALDSVAAQTRPPAITVVVDDGSSDASIARATVDHPEVVVIRQPPTGRSEARNRGTIETTNASILYLDADDRLHPAALESLARAFDADDELDLVHGRTYEFADEHLPPGPGVRAPSGIVTARLGGATLIRRTLWERVGPLDTALPRGEWIEWMQRAYASGVRSTNIDDVVLERRLHSGNRTAVDGENTHYVAVARAALARKQARGATP